MKRIQEYVCANKIKKQWSKKDDIGRNEHSVGKFLLYIQRKQVNLCIYRHIAYNTFTVDL